MPHPLCYMLYILLFCISLAASAPVPFIKEAVTLKPIRTSPCVIITMLTLNVLFSFIFIISISNITETSKKKTTKKKLKKKTTKQTPANHVVSVSSLSMWHGNFHGVTFSWISEELVLKVHGSHFQKILLHENFMLYL